MKCEDRPGGWAMIHSSARWMGQSVSREESTRRLFPTFFWEEMMVKRWEKTHHMLMLQNDFKKCKFGNCLF